MKLFILNKSYMDLDLPDPKKVHKLAFSELNYFLTVEETIPLNLFVEDGNRNYFFTLAKCDISKKIYQYEYRSLVMG